MLFVREMDAENPLRTAMSSFVSEDAPPLRVMEESAWKDRSKETLCWIAEWAGFTVSG